MFGVILGQKCEDLALGNLAKEMGQLQVMGVGESTPWNAGRMVELMMDEPWTMAAGKGFPCNAGRMIELLVVAVGKGSPWNSGRVVDVVKVE